MADGEKPEMKIKYGAWALHPALQTSQTANQNN
jgi:hypothetical protein